MKVQFHKFRKYETKVRSLGELKPVEGVWPSFGLHAKLIPLTEEKRC